MQAGSHRWATDTDARGKDAFRRQSIAGAQATALDQSPHKGNHLLAAAFWIPPHCHAPYLSPDPGRVP